MSAKEAKAADTARPSGAASSDVAIVRTGRMRVDALDGELAPMPPTQFKTFDHPAIRGVIPTVLTPYDESEQIDDVALRAQLQYLLDARVHGLLLMGSFGECPYLNDDDRDVVIRTCVEVAGSSLPIVVGITTHSTFVAAKQMRQAHRLGASAVMVCLPQYYKLHFDDVKRHYARLSEMNLLPIFYYHYPAATGLDLKPAQVAELLALPNVVGIKESTLDMLSIKRHIALAEEKNRIFLSGSELNFMQFMDLGGHGTVGAASLIMPRTAVAMYDAYQAGDRIKARELQSLLFETMPLAKRVGAPVGLVRRAFLLALRQGLEIPLDIQPTQARLKAALAHRGVPIKPIMRSPLPPLTADDAQVVEQAMTKIEEIEPAR
jgi:4-hydroxy-tetrahydrodipicolinate synthase/2-dehydro-3-deoxy-phosphogluconate/2-dehydro-3-deoxy-6-phosphogalactonate aldolase